MRSILLFCAAASLILSGCATSKDAAQPQENAAERAVKKTEAGLADAALTPLSDLNLKQKTIPPLLEAIENPYMVSLELSCEEIAAQVVALDGVLGRDWDIPPEDKEALQLRAADGASTALLDAIASGATGFIPYRGFLRQLTGASAHDRKVLKAYERGAHRRTFLKGIGLSKSCVSPAAPLPPPEEDEEEAVTFK